MALTPTTKKREIYSDLDSMFTINPISSDVTRKTNENAVKQSIKNLILTDRGEMRFRPNIGCNIRSLLFENITQTTLIMMREMIIETIENYEPRANLIEVTVESSIDSNQVEVSVLFSVINNEKPLLLEVILERIR